MSAIHARLARLERRLFGDEGERWYPSMRDVALAAAGLPNPNPTPFRMAREEYGRRLADLAAAAARYEASGPDHRADIDVMTDD